MVAPKQPAQPPLIVGLVNGILLFCGLVVAGCMTLAAAAAFANAPNWLRNVAGLTVVCAVVGGLAANFGLMNAVNLARRIEKNGNSAQAAASVERARWFSMAASNLGLLASAAAGVGVVILVVGFLTVSKKNSDVSPETIYSCELRSNNDSVTSAVSRVEVTSKDSGCVVTLSQKATSITPK